MEESRIIRDTREITGVYFNNAEDSRYTKSGGCKITAYPEPTTGERREGMRAVTISTSKSTGDKSYSHGIYGIVAENKTHVRVKMLGKNVPNYWAGEHILEKKDYDFTIAEGPMLTPEECRQMLIFHRE